MSFSVYLNSVNGTQVVAGQNNQITYNFDFRNTPKHEGAYRVRMSFASEQQTYSSGNVNFGVVRILDLGGVLDSYSPQTSATTTRQNAIMGIIRGSAPSFAAVQTVPTYTMTGTANIPANSGTNAYTLTTSTVIPTYSILLPAVQTIDAKFQDNPPVYLQTKPTNNQFTVRITLHDGVLYPSIGATHYGMILTFEAV